MAIIIELDHNGAAYNQLMWPYQPPPADPEAVPRPFRVEAFLLYRADQVNGTYTAVARVNNTPYRSSGGPMMMVTSLLGKVHHYDVKPGNEDLTWYYKIQRIDRFGNVHPDDATVDDLPPRTVLSFEETVGGYPLRQLGAPAHEHVRTITVLDGATLDGGEAVADFVQWHGQAASSVTLTPAGGGLVMAVNNRNNHRHTLAASSLKIPDRELAPVSTHLYRLIFANDTGGDIDVELKYVVGVHP